MSPFHSYPNTYVSQVHLLVSDLERSKNFYRKILGLHFLKDSERTVILSANGVDPLVTLEQSDQAAGHNFRQAGLYHFALLLPSRKDLASMLAHLLKLHYPLQGGSDHAVSEAVYLADPDGNGIELYRDRPSDKWRWNNGRVFMPTEAISEDILDELEDGEWKGMPEKTIMGHIHLQVADLKASEDFYCKGLGFDLVAQYDDQADFISTGGYHHHIGLNVWRSKGSPAGDEISAGMKHFILEYPSLKARGEAVSRLKGMEVPVTEKGTIITVRDPSNIKIVLHVSETN